MRAGATAWVEPGLTTRNRGIGGVVERPIRNRVWVWAFVAFLFPGPLSGQDMALPIPTQWSLFDRILGFDRALDVRSDDGLVLGVVYQGRNRVSTTARAEIVTAAREGSGRILNADGVRVVSLQASSPAELRRRLSEEGVDLIYITPLRAQDASEIAEVAMSLRIPTLTGVREYMEEGLCLGLGLRGGRPEILVNLDACRSVGMDLNSELLKLATVISPNR